jgi:UMF1 family MFS transporter
MKSTQVTVVAFIAQATGVLGGFAAPSLQRRLRISNKASMALLVGGLASICLYGCLGLIGGKDGFGGLRTANEMYAVAGLFGLTFGPFQAYARSVFAELIPPGQEARWFGLYSITDKSSSFFGPAIVGLIADRTQIRFGFVFLFAMLALPLPLLWWAVDVHQGREQARVYAAEDDARKASA